MDARLNPELTEIPLDRLRQRHSVKWSFYPDDVLPAWVAEMDFPLAEPIRTVLVEAVALGDTGYAYPPGAGLAEACAGFLDRRFGWQVDPESISSAPDVVGAITSLLRVLADPGERVMVNPPVYHPFFSAVEEVGCELIEVPLAGGRELDPEAIERAFADGVRVLLLCHPHNPTGRVVPGEQLEAIADAAARHGAWVLADEIHAPLTLPGAEHIPFLTVSPAAAEHGVALVSASKTFNIAGLSCAQMVTASPAAAKVVGALPESATHCGHFGALASAVAYRDGDPWLDDVLAVLDHNRNLLKELLADRLPEVGYRPPEASYLAWLDLRLLDLGDDPAEAVLDHGRLALSSGPQFGRGGEGFARLNFATTPALLREAVDRLARLPHFC